MIVKLLYFKFVININDRLVLDLMQNFFFWHKTDYYLTAGCLEGLCQIIIPTYCDFNRQSRDRPPNFQSKIARKGVQNKCVPFRIAQWHNHKKQEGSKKGKKNMRVERRREDENGKGRKEKGVGKGKKKKSENLLSLSLLPLPDDLVTPMGFSGSTSINFFWKKRGGGKIFKTHNFWPLRTGKFCFCLVSLKLGRGTWQNWRREMPPALPSPSVATGDSTINRFLLWFKRSE